MKTCRRFPLTVLGAAAIEQFREIENDLKG
jgi:hypothetical protein